MPGHGVASIDGHSRYKNLCFDQSLKNLKALHCGKRITVSDSKIIVV